MKLTLAFGLIFLSQVICGQKKSKITYPPPVLGVEYPEFISACELPNHKKELVYTRFTYSGVDEYWGLYPENNCNQIDADLYIPEGVVMQTGYLELLKEVHENYWKKHLIIDVVGTFDDGNPSGYGHLGSNNSKFTVKFIVDLYVVNTKPHKSKK